jgi:predicted NUDIX family NTP pyrophosphohydrolase
VASGELTNGKQVDGSYFMTSDRSDKKANKVSAGLLMYRMREEKLEVLLVHLGGPYWSRKDAGAWFVPKGGMEKDEDEFAAALREFQEETGLEPQGPFFELGSVFHKSGKRVVAWAFRGDGDPAALRSNTFRLEWPPKSGKFTVDAAAEKMHPAEYESVQRLDEIVFAREGERRDG